MNKYKNAVLVGEKRIPHCPTCGAIMGNGRDYKQVIYNGEQYTQRIVYCSDEKCSEKFVYYFKMEMDGNLRFVFDGDIEEVKEGENE